MAGETMTGRRMREIVAMFLDEIQQADNYAKALGQLVSMMKASRLTSVELHGQTITLQQAEEKKAAADNLVAQQANRRQALRELQDFSFTLSN